MSGIDLKADADADVGLVLQLLSQLSITGVSLKPSLLTNRHPGFRVTFRFRFALDSTPPTLKTQCNAHVDL